jgi:hypothetical protein
MRAPALTRHISDLPASARHTVRLDRDGAYRRPRVVDEMATLSTYPRPVRQLIITGLGREAPTVIVTNDRISTVQTLIERYARRMNIEQRLAESIRSFHTRRPGQAPSPSTSTSTWPCPSWPAPSAPPSAAA